MGIELTESEILSERIRHERELRETAASALEKALIIQADEYERRLHDLNEAYKRAADDRVAFLLRSEFVIQHNALAERLDAEKKTLAATLGIRADALEKRISICERMLWIAVGGVILIESISRFFE